MYMRPRRNASDENVRLSPHAEEFVARLMRRQFVRRLSTDLIFTSIVAKPAALRDSS